MTKMDWLKRLFTLKPAASKPLTPVEPGLYHTTRETDGRFTRFHLRVERDGTGMLIANASAAARLNASGVVIARGLLEDKEEAAILDDLKTHFEAPTEEILRKDIERVQDLVKAMLNPGDTYPVFSLEDPALSPYQSELIAPLQATLALAAPEQTLSILDRLWKVGIPHVTLSVPKDPTPQHLVRAIERAEDLGMIAGVRARATDLQHGTLLQDLWQAGVDHVTLLYAAPDPAIHDALCGEGDYEATLALFGWLQENQVAAVAEIPLISTTVPMVEESVTALMTLGADSLSFVAYATLDETLATEDGALHVDALLQVATRVEEAADLAQARFVWESPVERDPTQSLKAQVRRGPRCSAEVAIRVEPDGAVIPPRGPYRSAGNLLRDPWEAIWYDEAFRRYRERVEAPTRCDVCPGLALCAADCPREPQGWARKASSQPLTSES